MALLSDEDRQTVRAQFAALAHPVRLLFFTQTIGAPEAALVAKQILDEIVTLSDCLALEEVNFILDKDRAEQYGIEDIPAIAILRENEDTRIRFLGAPDGYEFSSLVDAVILAGSDDSGLSEESRNLIAEHVTGPVDIKVFVTPTCPHCPRVVTLAHRMAIESVHVHATCIEATQFMDLSRKYRVTGVPKTIVNGIVEILGAVPEEAFVRSVVLPPGSPMTDGPWGP